MIQQNPLPANEQVAIAARDSYRNLSRAGDTLIWYGRALRVLAYIGLAVALIVFVRFVGGGELAYLGTGSGLLASSGALFISGVFASASGEACHALSHIAVTSQATAEALRRASS